MRHVIFVIFFVIYSLFIGLMLPVFYLYEKRGLLNKKRDLSFRINQHFSKLIVQFSGCDLEVIGKEHIPQDEAVLFVGNHQSYLDIPFLVYALEQPIGFVAKKELAKIPIIGRWIYYTDSVFIDRKDIRQSLRAINEAADTIKSGHSMVIFPEGTRSKSDELAPFKPGSLKLAQKAKVSVIPVTTIDSYRLYEANGSRIKPGKVRIVINPPLSSTKEEGNKTIDNTMAVYQTIKRQLNEYKIKKH